MNILIIEDEDPAAERLEGLLSEAAASAKILARLDSVAAAVNWLSAHPAPDLIFLDIQLADGLSFEIFRQTEVNAPVIFTTAYDQYALDAFRVNSIDYLLKPVKREELTRALEKFNKTQATVMLPDLSQLIRQLQPNAPVREFKRRFLIRFGDKIKAIDVDQVMYFSRKTRSITSGRVTIKPTRWTRIWTGWKNCSTPSVSSGSTGSSSSA